MVAYLTASDFLGDAGAPESQTTFGEFLAEARDIRTCLGENYHLLDKYVQKLISAGSEAFVSDASQKGFDAAIELTRICSDILKGSTDSQDHSFYPVAKKYIDEHPLAIDGNLHKRSLYVAALSERFKGLAYKMTFTGVHKDMCAVIYDTEMEDLSRQIIACTGDAECMERLNSLFLNRFALVSYMDMFYQGEACNLLFALDGIDISIDKTVIQLLLEGTLPLDAEM